MKIGYLRSDDDGHNYVIPETFVGIFDCIMSVIGGRSYMDYPDAFDEFEDKFDKYRVDGELYNMKIIIEEE